MTRTRIFIIHENPARLRQAATLLNAHRHLRVLHLMSSVHECFPRLGVANCDFILVSATLPNEEVRKLLKYLRQQVMPTKVIVTDVPNDPQQILTYIAAGAVGYVLVQEGVGAWAKQIEAVCSGQPGFSRHGRRHDGASSQVEPVNHRLCATIAAIRKFDQAAESYGCWVKAIPIG